MSAKNIHHDAVKNALVADGWIVTHDPLTLTFGGKNLFVDLGAERAALAAEKDGWRIAVEVQSFLNPSPVRDVQETVGQYEIYRAILGKREPGRELYLAITQSAYDRVFADQFGQFIVQQLRLRIAVFEPAEQRIVQWID